MSGLVLDTGQATRRKFHVKPSPCRYRRPPQPQGVRDRVSKAGELLHPNPHKASRDLSSWATTMTHRPLPISLSFSRARPLHLHGGCLGICPVISDVKQAEVPIGGRSSARANPRAGPREISVEGTRRREIAGRGGCGACCLLLATPRSAKPRGVTGPGAWCG